MSSIEFKFRGNESDLVRSTDASKRALQGVERQASQTGGRASSSLSQIGAGATRGLQDAERTLLRFGTRAGLVLGGVGVAGVGMAGAMGLSFYRTKQSASIAFTTILKDGGKAQKLLNELQDFAAATPFEFPELLRASQMLLNVGTSAKEIIPTMTAVGNAVSAAGGDPETLQGTIRALGQIQSKGRLMAEEMNQLSERNVFSWQALADAIGTTIPKAMALVTAGQVDSTTFMQAFINSSNERFAGMMEAQSKTFSGLLSTLRDNISSTMATALTPFFQGAERGMAGLNKRMSDPAFQEGVERFGVRSGKALNDVIAYITRNREEILGMATDWFDAGKGVVQVLKGVHSALGLIADAIGGWDKLFVLLLSGRLALAVLALQHRFTALAGAEAAAGATGAAAGFGGAGAATGIAAASGKASGLLRTLNALTRFGLITILVEVLINKDSVDKLGNWIDDKLGLRNVFGAGKPGGVDFAVGGQDVGFGGGKPGSRVFPIPSGVKATVGGGPEAHGARAMGNWQSDQAVDIHAAPGTRVLAVASGTVRKISFNKATSGSVYGNSITIDGDDGTDWFYTHLRGVFVKVGQHVNEGQPIGTISKWQGGDAHVHIGASSRPAIDAVAKAQRVALQSAGATARPEEGRAARESTEAAASTKALAAAGIKPITLDATKAESAKKAKGLVVKGLDAEQTRNAKLIFDMALRAGLTDRQALELVAVAYQESGLRTNALNKDSGALGLFQLLSKGYMDKYRALLAKGLSPAQANIGAILPNYVKYFGQHPGARPGAAGAAVEASGEGAAWYAKPLTSGKFRLGAGGFAGFGGPGADTDVSSAIDQLGEARGIRTQFDRLSKTVMGQLGAYDDKSREEILKVVTSGRTTIRQAFKDKLITKTELDAVKGAFDKLGDAMTKGLDAARSKFDSAWDKFRTLIGKALSAVSLEGTIERRREVRRAGAAEGIIATITGDKSVTDQERQIKAAGDRVLAAYRAYAKATAGAQREAAADEIAIAEEQFAALTASGLGDRAQQLADAYKTLIEIVMSQEKQVWDTMNDEQSAAVDELLSRIQDQLASGKITYAEARKILAGELQALGIDIENVGSLLGEPFQQAMIKALNGIEQAVERLITLLGGVGDASADAVRKASTSGLIRLPDEDRFAVPTTTAAPPGEPGAGTSTVDSSLTVSVTFPGATFIGPTPEDLASWITPGVQQAAAEYQRVHGTPWIPQ